MKWITGYLFFCVLTGAILGWREWEIVAGIFGGAFLGLLIGVTSIYCFAIFLASFKRGRRREETRMSP